MRVGFRRGPEARELLDGEPEVVRVDLDHDRRAHVKDRDARGRSLRIGRPPISSSMSMSMSMVFFIIIA